VRGPLPHPEVHAAQKLKWHRRDESSPSEQKRLSGVYRRCNVAYEWDTLDGLEDSPRFSPHPAQDLDLGFRALLRGRIRFDADMEMTRYPASVTVRDIIRRTHYVSSAFLLTRGTVRLPMRLQRSIAMLRYLNMRTLRRERPTMIGTPRRLARFSVFALGQLAVALSILPRAESGDTGRTTAN
jgi:hypothetical protein